MPPLNKQALKLAAARRVHSSHAATRMTSTSRALAISLIERPILIVLQIASFTVLARLLTPEEIGLYAVAAAAVGLAQIIRDFGVGSYLIQESDLTKKRIRAAFTISVIAASVLFVAVLGGSGLFGTLYDDSRLTNVMRVLSLNFLLIPFGSIPLSLLRREMQFRCLIIVNVAAAITGFVVAVVLAALNFGYISLAWSSVSAAAVTCVLANVFNRGRASFSPSLEEWRRVTAFSTKITFVSVTNELAVNANDLIIGKFLGFHTTGLISRAQGVMFLFNREIIGAARGVALPAFARLHRADADLEDAYIRATVHLTAFAWPFYGFMSLFPTEVLNVLFGPQWISAAALVPIFCLGGAFSAMCAFVPTLLLARGEANLLVRMHLIIDPLRVLIVTLVVILYGTGAAYAIAFSAFLVGTMPLLHRLKDRVQRTNYAALALGHAKSGLATCCALALPLAYALLSNDVPLATRSLMVVASGFSVPPMLILGLYLVRHPVIKEPAIIAGTSRLRIALLAIKR